MGSGVATVPGVAAIRAVFDALRRHRGNPAYYRNPLPADTNASQRSPTVRDTGLRAR